MQLTRFTDLGLRVLMYLCDVDVAQATTIAEVSERFDVAHHHLTKVVQFMGQQGWLDNVRGKRGGMRLARPPADYRLGELVRALERSNELINCQEPPCILRGSCALKGLLNRGEQAFHAELDRFTLLDAVAGQTGEAIVTLHRAGRAAGVTDPVRSSAP